MKIDKTLNQIIKDIIKALSIFITQIFSVVTFHQILFSNYMSDSPFKHIIIIFVLLFIVVFVLKTLILINELILRLSEIKDENSKKHHNLRQNKKN